MFNLDSQTFTLRCLVHNEFKVKDILKAFAIAVQSYNLAVILQKETGKSMKKRVKQDILKGKCPVLKGCCPYGEKFSAIQLEVITYIFILNTLISPDFILFRISLKMYFSKSSNSSKLISSNVALHESISPISR